MHSPRTHLSNTDSVEDIDNMEEVDFDEEEDDDDDDGHHFFDPYENDDDEQFETMEDEEDIFRSNRNILRRFNSINCD